MWVIDFYRLKVIPVKVKITSFVVEEKGVVVRIASNFYHHTERSILYIYHTKKECQLACDKLNGQN